MPSHPTVVFACFSPYCRANKRRMIAVASFFLLLSDGQIGTAAGGAADALARIRAPDVASGVSVIAPSVSTSSEARRILLEKRWREATRAKEAKHVLVVVRSGLRYPLRTAHTSLADLRKDAERQLNISGTNFHVYLFAFDDDLELVEVQHVSYEARD